MSLIGIAFAQSDHGSFNTTTVPITIANARRITTGSINNFEQVLGHYTADGRDRTYLLTEFACFDQIAPDAATLGRIGLSSNIATFKGLNNNGTFVGAASGGAGLVWRGLLQSCNTKTPGLLERFDYPGAGSTELNAVNDTEQIVGSAWFAGGSSRAFFYDPVSGFTTVNPPAVPAAPWAGLFSYVPDGPLTLISVNNAGTALGWVDDSKWRRNWAFACFSHCTSFQLLDPSVLYDDETGEPIQHLQALYIYPQAVNQANDIVGYFTSDETCPRPNSPDISDASYWFSNYCTYGFYYHSGRFRVIHSGGRRLFSTYLTGLNDGGIVAGFRRFVDDSSVLFYGLPAGQQLAFLTASRGSLSDLNGDRRPDLLWQHPATGELWTWFLDGARKLSDAKIADPTPWRIVGTADFNGDNKPDLLWQHPATGELWIWFLDGTRKLSDAKVADATPWRIVGTADLNGDNKPDLLWQHPATGELWTWYLDGIRKLSDAKIADPTPWRVVGTADLNGDNKPDLLWQHPATGELWTWFLDGIRKLSDAKIADPTPWRIVGTGAWIF